MAFKNGFTSRLLYQPKNHLVFPFDFPSRQADTSCSLLLICLIPLGDCKMLGEVARMFLLAVPGQRHIRTGKNPFCVDIPYAFKYLAGLVLKSTKWSDEKN